MRLNRTQEEAVAASLRGHTGVFGGPGTGKTFLVTKLISAAIEKGIPVANCVVITPSRRNATVLREKLAALNITAAEPMARSDSALAFAILQQAHQKVRNVESVRMFSGAEQDAILADMLRSHREQLVPGPRWPEEFTEALGTQGFHDQLRDILMRCTEWDVTPAELVEIARKAGRPEWEATAQIYQEYLDVTTLSAPGAYDPAQLLSSARRALEQDEELLQDIRARIQMIVLDDAQELTRSSAQLISTLASPNTRVVALADPDQTVQQYRGSSSKYLQELVDELQAECVTLSPSYRLQSPQHPLPLPGLAEQQDESAGLVEDATGRLSLAQAQRRIRERIPVSVQTKYRLANSDNADAELLIARCSSAWDEAMLVAEACVHARNVYPYEQIAVIARNQNDLERMAMTAQELGVPVTLPAAAVPVANEPAVRPFLLALKIVLGHQADPLEVETLCISVLGGADVQTMRQLRRRLHAQEIIAGGQHSDSELLALALQEPGRLVGLGACADSLRRIRRVIAAGRKAEAQAVTSPEATLWEMWQASKLAEKWRQEALATGPKAERASHYLDAMIALFAAAKRYRERLPAQDTAGFFLHLESQNFGEDRLEAPQSSNAVEFLAAASATSRQWDVVIIPGLQDGTWPNMRLRGSLLGTEDLVDVFQNLPSSAEDRRREIAAAELRSFYVALSRARKTVLVTAVDSEDENLSPFWGLLSPEALPPRRRPLPALTLSGIVGSARAVLMAAGENPGGEQIGEGAGAKMPTATTSEERVPAAERADAIAGQENYVEADAASWEEERAREAAAAAKLLAVLTQKGVRGADPGDWWSVRGNSTHNPIFAAAETISISPSKVETFSRCPLRWLLTEAGGQPPLPVSAGLGTLVHALAEHYWEDPQKLIPALEASLPSLKLGTGWGAKVIADNAEKMVNKLRNYLSRTNNLAVYPEYHVKWETENLRISGSIDRLEVRGNSLEDAEYVVVDFKTGSMAISAREAAENPQMACYQWVISKTGTRDFTPQGCSELPSGGAELVYLGTGTKSFTTRDQDPLSADTVSASAGRLSPQGSAPPPAAVPTSGPNLQALGSAGTAPQVGSAEWAENLFYETGRQMRSATFPARRNETCRSCPSNKVCPAYYEGDEA